MGPEDLWFQYTLAQQRQQAAIRQAQANQLLIRLVQAHSPTPFTAPTIPRSKP